MCAIEYSQLKSYKEKINNKFSEENVNKFFNNTSRILAKELYDELWSRTPVITGFLRHGWNVGLSSKYQNARLYPKKPMLFPRTQGQIYSAVKVNFKKIIPDKDGLKYKMDFNNPVSYAPFVEYGHKTTVAGRKVIKKDGKVKLFSRDEWVKPRTTGHHMTYYSVKKVKEKAPKIIKEELNKFLKGGG